MSFQPTAFRPFARGGWGGLASSHFRGVTKDWRGQVGTVQFRMPGGRSNAVLNGISRDNVGAVLGGCEIELYHGRRLIALTTSDGAGNFQFLNPGSGPFRVIATKAGVAGVSGENLTAAIV